MHIYDELKKRASKSGRFKLSKIAYKDNIGLGRFSKEIARGNTYSNYIMIIANANNDYWKNKIPKSYFNPVWSCEAIKNPLSKKKTFIVFSITNILIKKMFIKRKSKRYIICELPNHIH